ncbi:MAG: 4a-hydroxytetrahydrobiopterin dehydratase [Bryobacteraceae bacterium]
MTRLDAAEIEAALADLAGWSLRDGKLHREYQFQNFVHAFGFMATCAPAIEAQNHHPEWCNSYGRVTVNLVTHDVGGISSKDVSLARFLESMAQKLL